MRLGYTILYVPDVPATLKFYKAAFGFTTRFLHESEGYGELETGSTALAFSAHRLMQQLSKNPQAANAHGVATTLLIAGGAHSARATG